MEDCSDGYRRYEKCLHSWPNPANYMMLSEEDMGDMIVEFVVEEGEVFVCGDNRAHSLDSRYVGTIDERQILGKVLVRVFPNPAIMNHVDYVEANDKLVAEK
jgi:signal peptidase I